MAVKTSTPWWISGVLFVGLLLLFAGERALSDFGTASTLLSGVGLVLIAGATGVRAFSFAREAGKRRAVEGVMLVCNAGVLLALLIYFFASKDADSDKVRTMATVAWLIVMAISIIPLIMIEISLGFTGRDWFPTRDSKYADESAVELVRVREMATSGLTIALAMAFLMVTCNTMKERDIRKDVSYFKTSAPGSATVQMVKKMPTQLRVILFFPEVNQVADEVEAYFRQLSQKSGGNVVVERHDRMVSPTLANEHKVTADGTVVLFREPSDDEKAEQEAQPDEDKGKAPQASQSEKLVLPTEFAKARGSKLREFDADVQKALMKVLRPKRVAYFSVGHGELNDPSSVGPTENRDPMARSTLLKQLMGLLNYQVKDWDGFGKPVPDDATLLFVLAPRHPLLPEELAAIDDFLGRGGALLMALDPNGEADLGAVGQRLGLKFKAEPIVDDKEFMVRRHNSSDHRMILTNQFSSHASVTTLSRGGVRSGILLIEPGHLEGADFLVDEGSKEPKRTWIIRSMDSAFVDKNGNAEFDEGETRAKYNLAAAVEAEQPNEDGKTMRALVFADAELFSDVLLRQVPLVQALAVDSVKWLGEEEDLAGETVSEKDVRIEHTKKEDVVWFYMSLVGAPVLILGLGLGAVMWRRRRAQRRRA